MEKKRRIIIITLSALAVAGLLCLLLRPSEPTYQSRTLTKWLSEYTDLVHKGAFRVKSPKLDKPAHAIKTIGTNGIPTLIKLLQARDIKGSQQLELFARQVGWESFHITPAEEKWDMADWGFSLVGKDAEFAAPEMVHLLSTSPPEAVPYILDCLLSIQPPGEIVLPVLSQQFTTTNPVLKLRIAICLEALRPKEVENAGVYKTFPAVDPPSTNPPAATK